MVKAASRLQPQPLAAFLESHWAAIEFILAGALGKLLGSTITGSFSSLPPLWGFDSTSTW